jgi:hypothetical protein
MGLYCDGFVKFLPQFTKNSRAHAFDTVKCYSNFLYTNALAVASVKCFLP